MALISIKNMWKNLALTIKIYSICLFLVSQVSGLEKDDYSCDKSGNWCQLKDYDPLTPPISETSGTVTVYFTFRADGPRALVDAVKKVDDDRMVITFEPGIMLAWEDYRILTNYTADLFTPLPDRQMQKIWVPNLTVYNREKTTSSFRDPGNYSEDMPNFKLST